MTTTYGPTYDGLNLNDGTYRVTYDSGGNAASGATAGLFAVAPTRHVVTPYATRPGGTLFPRPPGPLTLTYGGVIVAPLGDGTLEAKRAQLLATLSRPRRRFVPWFADGRYATATATNVQCQLLSPTYATWSADFVLEDAYWAAPTPAADVRALALALAPGATTTYRQQFTVAPGGQAPSPIRAIFTNTSNNVTPLLWQVANLSITPGISDREIAGVRVATTAAVPLGWALMFDGDLEEVWVVPLAGIAGFWLLAESAGPALDFSGNGRDLTATGGVTWLQDGPSLLSAAVAFDGSTGYLSSSSTAFDVGGGNFTVGAWVNPGTAPGALVGIMGKSAVNAGWNLSRAITGPLVFAYGTGTTAASFTAATTLAAGAWWFVVVTYTAASRTVGMWVNGTLEYQAPTTAPIAAASNPFLVGAADWVTGGRVFWPGRVATPFVITTVLSQDQIRGIYRRGPWALGAQQSFFGTFPTVDPAAGATNLIEVRADHPSLTPQARSCLIWRPRYP
jgi:hypothetical protein